MLEGFRSRAGPIVVRDTSRWVSGREFAEMVDRYAQALAARGPGAGDRVALLATETPEALAVRYAVALVGAASVFTPDTGPTRATGAVPQAGPSSAARRLPGDGAARAGRRGPGALGRDGVGRPGGRSGRPGRGGGGPARCAVRGAGPARTTLRSSSRRAGPPEGPRPACAASTTYAALLGDVRDPDRKLLTCSAFAYVSQVLIAQTLSVAGRSRCGTGSTRPSYCGWSRASGSPSSASSSRCSPSSPTTPRCRRPTSPRCAG